MSKNENTHIISRMLYLVSGIVLLGVSGFMFSRATLGMDPVSVLYDGVSVTTGKKLGTATMYTSITILCILLAFNRKSIGIGTLMVTFAVGPIINIIMQFVRYIPDTYTVRMVFLIIAILIFGVAEGLYIYADLGSGPLDAIMIKFADVFKINLGISKIIFDIVCVVVGGLLGGKIGIGTLGAAILTGPIMNITFKVLMKLNRKSRGEILLNQDC